MIYSCICFQKVDLVLDVLNWKSSWDIKREPFRSWRSENEEQDRGQECNWDTSAVAESGVWLQSWPSSYLGSRSPYRLNFRPGNLTMYWWGLPMNNCLLFFVLYHQGWFLPVVENCWLSSGGFIPIFRLVPAQKGPLSLQKDTWNGHISYIFSVLIPLTLL